MKYFGNSKRHNGCLMDSIKVKEDEVLGNSKRHNGCLIDSIIVKEDEVLWQQQETGWHKKVMLDGALPGKEGEDDKGEDGTRTLIQEYFGSGLTEARSWHRKEKLSEILKCCQE